MQRGNPGRETQRGDWVLTPPLKRLLLVVLPIESISKILQLRLESLRLESLGVDVRTELVSWTVSKSDQIGSHQLVGIQKLDRNVASPLSRLAFHDARNGRLIVIVEHHWTVNSTFKNSLSKVSTKNQSFP